MTFVQTSPHNATSPQDLPGFDPPHSSRSALAAPSPRHPVTPSLYHLVTAHPRHPCPLLPRAHVSPEQVGFGWIARNGKFFHFPLPRPDLLGLTWIRPSSLQHAARPAARTPVAMSPHLTKIGRIWSDLPGFPWTNPSEAPRPSQKMGLSTSFCAKNTSSAPSASSGESVVEIRHTPRTCRMGHLNSP